MKDLRSLEELINSVETNRTYKVFIKENGNSIENILNDFHNSIKNAFNSGFKAGNESGEFNGELKAKMKLVISLIKFTDLDDDVICKIVEKEVTNAKWTEFIKETREKLK